MPDFTPGQTVKVKCVVAPGAFPTEYLVIIDASPEPVSGFVKRDDIEITGEGQGAIIGRIESVSPEKISVRIKGNFFTTTGMTYFPRQGAETKLQPIFT